MVIGHVDRHLQRSHTWRLTRGGHDTSGGLIREDVASRIYHVAHLHVGGSEWRFHLEEVFWPVVVVSVDVLREDRVPDVLVLDVVDEGGVPAVTKRS